MKCLGNILLFPPSAEEKYRVPHHLWLGVCLTGMGLCIGFLTLALGATACLKLDGEQMFHSYFQFPSLVALNLLPPVLLVWLFYLLSGRAWVGYLGGFVPCVGLGLVNYFKVRLRGDPLLGADLLLVTEAKGMVGKYTLDLTWLVWAAAGSLVLGLLFAIFLLPRGVRSWKVRLPGVLAFVGLGGVLLATVYSSPKVYQSIDNGEQINPWSDVEIFVSKGFLYPFLYSVQDMIPTPPEGYHKAQAQQLLEQYPDEDIPQEQKVDVVGIMLEAFCDLTDFSALAEKPQVQQVYQSWHQLEEQSVHGDLLTNIFAGGTVDSEWSFLTGYSQYDQFRSPTDSYVWYLRQQGYNALFHHPGYSWFYNRQNVNGYLGFQDSYFTENRFGDLVDPVAAAYHSDKVLVDQLLQELEQLDSQTPMFSFSVSYQNHGPYESSFSNQVFLTSGETGWSEESCNILNNYLYGVSETIEHMTRLAQELEKREQPTVLVLFGDHKPWLGNGESVYREMGVDFDLGTLAGFKNYYSTPYLIWANSAAKEVLGQDFVGEGGDFSPCFLMTKLFDLCSWEGSGFMQLSRQMRQISPLVHARGLFLVDGALTDSLGQEESQFYLDFLGAQYYRETEVIPGR